MRRTGAGTPEERAVFGIIRAVDYVYAVPLLGSLLIALGGVRWWMRRERLRTRLKAGHRPTPGPRQLWKSDRAEMRAFEHTTTVLETIRKPPPDSGAGRSTRPGRDPTTTRGGKGKPSARR
jgi:hypothetical protein